MGHSAGFCSWDTVLRFVHRAQCWVLSMGHSAEFWQLGTVLDLARCACPRSTSAVDLSKGKKIKSFLNWT